MSPFVSKEGSGFLRRTWAQRLVVAFNLVLIGSSLIGAGLLGWAGGRASSINRVALDRSLTELDEIASGQRVLNILLVGSDSSANLDPDDPIQIGRQGERLGDVVIIAHLDERSGSVSLLSLPRDLWVPMAGSGREDRINRAFLVGGAATLIDTIEEAIGIPIHHYVNVDFAGFEGLVDAVGSVEIQFDTPARDWNVNAEPEPRSQTGFEVTEAGCHSLEPRQALAYVRSRYYQTQDESGQWVTDPTSDLGRISRQQDFLRRLAAKSIELGARNPLVLADLIDVAIQNVAIDQELTPGMLIDLSATYRNFDPGDMQTYTFPVDDGTVGANRVLLPRYEDAAPLVALFNGERLTDPATIAVRVVFDPALAAGTDPAGTDPAGTDPAGDAPEPVRAVVDQLAAAGFDVASVTPGTVAAGLRVRHGSADARAADVVASALLSRTPTSEPIADVAPQPSTGLAYDPVIGSQLVSGQAATGALVSQPASSSREQVIFEEAPAISGRHVVVTVGVPTAPGTSNDSAAPYPADPSVFDGGEVAEGAVAGPLIDPADPFGTAGDRGAETGEVGAGTDQESC